MLCHHGQRIDVRRLALIGAHAECRIALQVLDREVAFFLGVFYVLRSHVGLEIDKGLAFAAGHGGQGRRNANRLAGHRVRWQNQFGFGEPGVRGGSCACRRTFSYGSHLPECSHHGAGSEVAGGEATGHEGGDHFVVFRLDAAVRRQMHGGRPAAGHAEHIALDGCCVSARQFHAGQRLRSFDIGNAGAGENRNAKIHGSGNELGRGPRTQIGDGDGNACGGGIESRAIGAIVVGDDDGALAGGNGKAVEISSDGGGEHDSRAVIIREHQRALDGACCQNQRLVSDVNEDLACFALGRIGQQVLASLDADRKIAVIEALGNGADAEPGIGK